MNKFKLIHTRVNLHNKINTKDTDVIGSNIKYKIDQINKLLHPLKLKTGSGTFTKLG